MPHLRARRAFTLVEVLVAVTVIAIMAAMTIPTVISRLTVARANALAKELLALNQGLQAFKTNVGAFPHKLDYLSAIPGASTTQTYCSEQSTTGNPNANQIYFTTAQANGWHGPYVSRVLVADANYNVNDFVIQDFLGYVGGTPAYVTITINNVDASIAPIVEEIIDGPVVSGSYTTGSFTWDQSSTGTYRINTTACP